VLVNIKSGGNGYMEDFFAAARRGAVRELKPLLNIDAVVTFVYRRDARRSGVAARQRRSLSLTAPYSGERKKTFEPQGGLVAGYSATWRQRRAILKRSAAEAKLFEHEGRRWVCSRRRWILPPASDDPGAECSSRRTLWCCRTLARMLRRRCRRRGYLPIPRKLATEGRRTWVRSRRAP